LLLSIEDHPDLAELANTDLGLNDVPLRATEATQLAAAPDEACVVLTVAAAAFVAGVAVGAYAAG